MLRRLNDTDKGILNYLENKQLQSHFVHHKSHTWTGLESNPLLRDEIPATNHLSH